MSAAAKKKPAVPVSSLNLPVDIIEDTCSAGVLLRGKDADALKAKAGDYLEIECDAKGTKIVREFSSCDCFVSVPGLCPGYVYMDYDSASYLCADPGDVVSVRKSDCCVNVP